MEYPSFEIAVQIALQSRYDWKCWKEQGNRADGSCVIYGP